MVVLFPLRSTFIFQGSTITVTAVGPLNHLRQVFLLSAYRYEAVTLASVLGSWPFPAFHLLSSSPKLILDFLLPQIFLTAQSQKYCKAHEVSLLPGSSS